MPQPAFESKRPDTSACDLRRRLAITFERTANVLERSAQLAEEEADRQARDGHPDRSATERQHAQFARRAAARARSNAALLAEKATCDPDVSLPSATRDPDDTRQR